MPDGKPSERAAFLFLSETAEKLKILVE